ncbi:hypothetical protein DSO57_1025707 [Entomophthora muscae]|uniref:Uncharacterized protein n=1 Tax=Entomophthora muscae TaxID=34485 RepID=A0ACC2UBP9_9FUNG|nr:hypothetical protein DSO57_1025707 [Entomophthora muscae]
MQTVKDFALSRTSEVYFLRFGSNKPFQLPDYDVANPILNLHLPVFNWLESKFTSGAFKGDEDSIRELDSNVTTIGRFYIMSNRALIQECLGDLSSVILMCVTLNLDAKVNHFLLFVRPFGDQRKMAINSRGDLEGYPKSWFWGKIVKCLLLDQDYQTNKAAFKPVRIGNLDSEIPARFLPLTELFEKYV